MDKGEIPKDYSKVYPSLPKAQKSIVATKTSQSQEFDENVLFEAFKLYSEEFDPLKL